MPGSLFDSNIWLAAIFPTHVAHRNARQVLWGTTADSPAVFCRSTQLSFLRLASSPALLKIYGAEGLTNRDALIALNSLLVLPHVCERPEPPGLVAEWHQLASRETASPKVWMDAYLAAFAMAGGLRLVTLDGDFKSYRAKGLDFLLITASP